jgi:hypothetical protein
VQNNGYLVINASKNPALVGVGIQRVAARGVSSSGQSIPTGVSTTILWDASKTYDTHGALNAATGTFTAPETGYYQVTASILYSNSAWNVANVQTLTFIKNSSFVVNARRNVVLTTINDFYHVNGTEIVYLNKNDTLRVATDHTKGVAATLHADSTYNYFSIAKVSGIN